MWIATFEHSQLNQDVQYSQSLPSKLQSSYIFCCYSGKRRHEDRGCRWGAVGVEIAGDIMEDYKDKADVYLIHPRENLVNDEVNETFQSTIKAKLESLGVTMFLGMSLLHLCYTVCLC